MAIHVPIVMYCLRLFMFVLQELHCLPNYLHICMIKARGAITSPSFVTLLLLVTEIAIYIAWGCLLLFYKNYIVYRIVYMFVWSELEVAISSPSFVALLLLVSEIAKCIAWGCLLLFYKNCIIYYTVYCYYCGVFIEKYVCTKLHRNWLLCEWVTWPYMSLS